MADISSINVAILVKIENSDVGKQQRKKFVNSSLQDAIPITPVEAKFSVGKNNNIDVTRTQFPLTVAFACTIHKVQGLSLDKLVESIANAYQPRQAYVDLGRARTLDGLHLLDFDLKRVKPTPAVDKEMNRMRENLPLTTRMSLSSVQNSKFFKITHINCRSLVKHLEDIKHHRDLLSFDIICVTETWLRHGHSTDNLTIPGFKMFRHDRQVATNWC